MSGVFPDGPTPVLTSKLRDSPPCSTVKDRVGLLVWIVNELAMSISQDFPRAGKLRADGA